ncbi:glycosyl hydrolase family 28-related protein [Fibrella aquatica]|uniref:glycosyl hydrolase family 28-related protein n=1 Tax=Fibrella aquatica TaxID=3242487 RepID=UPI003520EC96
MAINVIETRFGAVGDGNTDDTLAIQKAINFAKSQSSPGGATYRPTVYFPAGYYLITAPINLTGISGIWLTGDGGKWLNTCIIGNTGGIMFDFSGSDQAGCENFYFLSTPTSTNRSTIGVQFALTSSGGLNCGIRNCSFLMFDFPTANNGLGTIGIINIRSEEFYVHECFVRANTPVILTNSSSLNAANINYTASSPNQTLTAGVGSMGVTNLIGVSLQAYEKRQPAMILNGTNSLNFQGYISRGSQAAGSNETAILCSQYTTNLRIHATIESFSRALQLVNATLEGTLINLAVANSTAPMTEIINMTGCYIKGLQLQLSLPNPNERANRYIIYSAPNGNQQAIGFIRNSEISCYDLPNNQYVVSADILKKSYNVVFQTENPFEKKGGRIRVLDNTIVSAGTLGSITAAVVFRFRQANQLPITNINGGYYRICLDGVIRGGSYGSGFSCTLSFQAQIVVNQLYNGVFDTPSITVITLDKSVSNPAYIDIVGVIVNISFANGIGIVSVTPRIMGNGTGEPVNYDGYTEIQSDFLVNDPIPIG